MADAPSPSPHNSPHLKLNSASNDLFLTQNNDRPTAPSRQASSRTLTSRPPTAPSVRNNPGLANLYAGGLHESATSLLPPSNRSRTHRFRDEESLPGTPTIQSRRTSWSSDGQSRDSRIYGMNPFEDSRAPSRAGSDDDNINTQTVSEKYTITPTPGLLLFPEDIEQDDSLHNPGPDDEKNRECDIFNRRGFMNIGGLAVLTLGLLILFIGYPILTFVKKYTDAPNPCKSNPDCIGDGKAPLLKNIRTTLIDSDTPKAKHSKKAADGSTLKLVFSDEFNTPGRSFYPGDDPYFQAMDIWYGVTQDLEWYDPDAATTKDGVLELRFDAYQNHGLNYRSGMLQSWNKTCFTGGMLEASISLPGRGDTVGFWPGFWAMGNLGRPGYAATTDGMWPYSYNDDKCDAGITANQSQTDGISYLPGMRLPPCTCAGEDHPNAGKSRSAPEIDVIEASVLSLDTKGNSIGGASQSCQIAPFDIWYQPDTNFMEFYDPSISTLNSYQGAPFQQAMSGMTNLNNDWYDGKAYQTYSFQYTPGAKGNIVWSVGEQQTWKLDARAIGPNGNVGQRTIPTEPLAIIANFGMADGFSAINYTGIAPLLPATMRFDYIRIYQPQDADQSAMSCDPPDYPTSAYIVKHANAYTNPNLTTWDLAGHKWPKNTLVDGCKAGSS